MGGSSQIWIFLTQPFVLLLFSRPDGNPICQCGSCCHQICQHRTVLSYVQERHALWIGAYATWQHFSGGQGFSMLGRGGRAVEAVWYIGVPSECHPMFDFPEETENLRNLPMKSSEGCQAAIINHGCAPAPCLTLQKLELACSIIKIDSREKKPNLQWQAASWAYHYHLSPCVPSANCCFEQKAFKSNHLSLLKSNTIQTLGVWCLAHVLARKHQGQAISQQAAIRQVPLTI